MLWECRLRVRRMARVGPSREGGHVYDQPPDEQHGDQRDFIGLGWSRIWRWKLMRKRRWLTVHDSFGVQGAGTLWVNSRLSLSDVRYLDIMIWNDFWHTVPANSLKFRSWSQARSPPVRIYLFWTTVFQWPHIPCWSTHYSSTPSTSNTAQKVVLGTEFILHVHMEDVVNVLLLNGLVRMGIGGWV